MLWIKWKLLFVRLSILIYIIIKVSLLCGRIFFMRRYGEEGLMVIEGNCIILYIDMLWIVVLIFVLGSGLRIILSKICFFRLVWW